jgi:hypothetical protein
LRPIEEQLQKSIRKVLGKDFLIAIGPFTETKYSGVQPEVFIHAHSLHDLEGVMPDGARVSRRPAKGTSTFMGFEEERPGRIEVLITCTSGSYKQLQETGKDVIATVLFEMQMLPKIPLGQNKDKSVDINFEDYTSQLHKAEYGRVLSGDHTFFKGVLTFYLTGFIHLYLTRRGGFKSKATSGKKIRTRKITTATIKRSIKTRKEK